MPLFHLRISRSHSFSRLILEQKKNVKITKCVINKIEEILMKHSQFSRLHRVIESRGIQIL